MSRERMVMGAVMGAVVWLLSSNVAAAMTFEVRPGQSIQAAINHAVGSDTILIYGEPGYQYREALTLPSGITLQGIGNPSLRPPPTFGHLVVQSHNTLQGLTLMPGGGDYVAVEIPSGVTGVRIEQCALVGGFVIVSGNGNTISESTIRSGSGVLFLHGSSNTVRSCVLRCLSPYSPTTPTPVLKISGANNLITNSTLFGWGSVTVTDLHGQSSTYYSTGIEMTATAGTGNRAINSIIANNGPQRDVISAGGPIDVSYTLLEQGTSSPSVRLGASVLPGTDPQFVDRAEGDLRLQASSPAIDRGDTSSPVALDPDGTILDLGALSFDQRVTGALDPAVAETPWQTNAFGSLTTNIAWNYNMGYQFVPQVAGEITKLGGFFNGTKTVRLYDSSGSVLAFADVTAANTWAYTAIAPVAVNAGQTYTVAVNLAGSGASYRVLTTSSLPRTFGNIEIRRTVYRLNSELMPTSGTTIRMYGQADIEFVPRQ